MTFKLTITIDVTLLQLLVLTIFVHSAETQSRIYCVKPNIPGGYLTASIHNPENIGEEFTASSSNNPYYVFCYRYKRSQGDIATILQNKWYCSRSGWTHSRTEGYDDVCVDLEAKASAKERSKISSRRLGLVITFTVVAFVIFGIAAMACCAKKKVSAIGEDQSSQDNDDDEGGSKKKKKKHKGKHKHRHKHKKHKHRKHGGDD